MGRYAQRSSAAVIKKGDNHEHAVLANQRLAPINSPTAS